MKTKGIAFKVLVSLFLMLVIVIVTLLFVIPQLRKVFEAFKPGWEDQPEAVKAKVLSNFDSLVINLKACKNRPGQGYICAAGFPDFPYTFPPKCQLNFALKKTGSNLTLTCMGTVVKTVFLEDLTLLVKTKEREFGDGTIDFSKLIKRDKEKFPSFPIGKKVVVIPYTQRLPIIGGEPVKIGPKTLAFVTDVTLQPPVGVR